MTGKADKSSLVTTVIPQAAVGTCFSNFQATIGYSAAATFFHEESGEDFTAHRGWLTASAQVSDLRLEFTNSIVVIDSSDTGPTWTGPGGAPATGGPAVRDRREAMIYRGSVRATQPFGNWLVRPIATYYIHDWGTDERSTPGYQNYVDRNEWTAGLDLGRRLQTELAVFVGYRFGEQNQAKLLHYPERYDSEFHRVLFEIEGSVTSWLKANAAIGPEFREYANTVATAFQDRSRLNCFADVSVTLLPTKCDSITLAARQFQQPGFAGRSTYDDITYDFDWRRKFSSRWTAGVGTRAYSTHFLRPVKRNDWVVSPNVFASCALTRQFAVECSAAFETGFTGTRNSDARDYNRTLVTTGLRYAWH